MNEVLKKEGNELLPLAEEFLKQTRLDLDDAKTSFFKIGFRLNEANRGGYFRALGYEDIYALALDEFGFEKTTTKNLMAINYKYCVHGTGSGYSLYSMQIAEKYRKYSQTQLVEMLPLMDREREHVPEDFTIAELRDYKKVCKNPTVYGVSWESYSKDPRASVKQYREKKAAEERKVRVKRGIINIDTLSRNFQPNEVVTLEAVRARKLVAKDVDYLKSVVAGSDRQPQGMHFIGNPESRDDSARTVHGAAVTAVSAGNVPGSLYPRTEEPEEQQAGEVQGYAPVPDDQPGPGILSIERTELELIRRALDKYHGNRKLAAEELGISERTLYRKLKSLEK